jgi:hypothetical protein
MKIFDFTFRENRMIFNGAETPSKDIPKTAEHISFASGPKKADEQGQKAVKAGDRNIEHAMEACVAPGYEEQEAERRLPSPEKVNRPLSVKEFLGRLELINTMNPDKKIRRQKRQELISTCLEKGYIPRPESAKANMSGSEIQDRYELIDTIYGPENGRLKKQELLRACIDNNCIPKNYHNFETITVRSKNDPPTVLEIPVAKTGIRFGNESDAIELPMNAQTLQHAANSMKNPDTGQGYCLTTVWLVDRIHEAVSGQRTPNNYSCETEPAGVQVPYYDAPAVAERINHDRWTAYCKSLGKKYQMEGIDIHNKQDRLKCKLKPEYAGNKDEADNLELAYQRWARENKFDGTDDRNFNADILIQTRQKMIHEWMEENGVSQDDLIGDYGKEQVAPIPGLTQNFEGTNKPGLEFKGGYRGKSEKPVQGISGGSVHDQLHSEYPTIGRLMASTIKVNGVPTDATDYFSKANKEFGFGPTNLDNPYQVPKPQPEAEKKA